MFDAIILMAGRGTRTELGYNKVLYEVENKPVFRYSLEVFLNSPACQRIVLVVHRDEETEVLDLLSDLNTTKIEFAIGGESRQESVQAGIEKCKSEIVLIHDGARPFIREEDILNIYKATKQYSASVLAVKTIDTIKESRDGKLFTLARENLWNIQTPQGIDLELFKKALKQAKSDKILATDDVGLLEKYFAISPKIVPGSYKNIKITTQEDLDYFEFLIKEKKWIIK